MAAGFGSQLALLIWAQEATSQSRKPSQAWLNTLGQGSLFESHRTLRYGQAPSAASKPKATAQKSAAPKAPAKAITPDHQNGVLAILSEKTGYAVEDLALDYELEADLGIDTVKQAEVVAELQEQFGIGETETQLSEVQTIAALIEWVKSNAQGGAPVAATIEPTAQAAPVPSPASTPTTAASIDPSKQVIEIIAEQTGYGTDDIELDYELEADLGIDTVKQAEIFSMLQEQFGIGETDTQLSEVQTIAALIEWVRNNAQETALLSRHEAPGLSQALHHKPPPQRH